MRVCHSDGGFPDVGSGVSPPSLRRHEQTAVWPLGLAATHRSHVWGGRSAPRLGIPLPSGATIGQRRGLSWAHTILRYERGLEGGVTARGWQYVGIDAIPDDGDVVAVAVQTSSMMAEMTDATFDPSTRTATTGLAGPPRCASTTPDELLFAMGGDSASTGQRHYWQVMAPFGASITCPEIDEAILAETFPDDAVVNFWSLRARAQSDLGYDHFRNGWRAFASLRQQPLIDARSGGTLWTSEIVH